MAEAGSASGKRELFIVWIRIRRYAAVMPFGSGSSFDWTSMMNAELTAEKRPAYMPPCSAFNADCRNEATNEDEGRVQVLVVLFCVIAIKFPRYSAVCGEEVGSGIVGPQWFEEFSEGGMEAGPKCQ